MQMTAFLNQHSTFVPDSFIVPITSNYMTNLLEQETITSTTTFFPQTLSHVDLQEIPLYAQVHETTTPDKSISVKVPLTCTSTDSSVNVKEDTISAYSMVVDHKCGGDQVTHVVPMQRKIKSIDMKVEGDNNAKKQRKHSGLKKAEKRRLKPDAKKQKKVPEDAPTGYVHVRARRGQATDRHSLAERVRREKISERMKMLQSLVPGCDKIVGKAHILDEIINYVQSLQNQVQCLAGKLASIDSMFSDFDTNTLESEVLYSDVLYFQLSQCEMTFSSNINVQKLCSSELPLPSVLESNSSQLTSFFDTTPTLTSMFLHQEQIFNVNSQDKGNMLWGTDDRREKIL